MYASSPQPAVLHLFTVFRQINAGELRIPAFQRSFIWKDSQVLDLLSSVREGFPIGSILLWHVDSKMLEVARHEVTAFPDLPEQFPTSYVLDGMQRLSSLFGVFHHGAEASDSRFNIYYDLRSRRFLYEDDMDQDVRRVSLQLSALLSPRRLLQFQGRFANLPDGDHLLEELLALQAAFQDYLIPIVSIRGEDVPRIVEIFERTNSTGTRLDTVDFLRAITWDKSFDLNDYLEKSKAPFLKRGLQLSDEIIVKCVGLLIGVVPSSKGLLSLRIQKPIVLARAFRDFVPAFERVVEYLHERFKIEDMSYVPYEGQVLVLFRALGMREAKSEQAKSDVERWFWAVGFNESLRGAPDPYVVRAIENWASLVNGKVRGLEPRLKLSEQDFVERRLIKGKALSAAFTSMLARQGACSIIDGGEIPSEDYMSRPDLKAFSTLYTSAELRSGGIDVGASPRVLANVVIADQFYDSRLNDEQSIRGHILELSSRKEMEALATQFIDAKVTKAIRSGDVAGALQQRAKLMHRAAGALIDESL